MESVLISINPKYCELIANGKKTIEVRKTRPKLETPFKCYIYCTAIKDKKRYTDEFDIPIETGMWKGNSHIIGEFMCDKIVKLKPNWDGVLIRWHEWDDEDIDYEDMCLSEEELETYLGLASGYGWHISDLVIYDKPKELGEFRKLNGQPLSRPFQSWGYVCSRE